jgi:hypothetical protein
MSFLNPDKTYNANGLTVKEYLLTKHNPNNIDMPTANLPSVPLGVTVHNTEAISVSSSTTMAEQYLRSTVNGNMKDVRVHFYVDDICAWQCLPLTLSGWHAADGNGDGNRKTIAIEVIGNSTKAEANAIKLVAYLLNLYNLTVEKNLFTHTHWLNVKDGKTGTIDYLNTASNSKKNCPIYILPHWSTFKTNVSTALNKLKGNNNSTNVAAAATKTVTYRVRKAWEDASSQIGAYSSLENAKKACKTGYSVFDENGKSVYSNNASTSTSSSTTVPDIKYRVYTNGKWYSEITNYNDTNDMGYSGVENKAISGLAATVTKGTLKYRVHIKNGGWLSWITKYNINDWNIGCAGLKSQQIDAIQMVLSNCDEYQVKYRVSTTSSKNYYDWVIQDTDYAGSFGKPIDKIQAVIVKK